MTEYVILCRAQDKAANGKLWEEWGVTVKAHAPDAAIRSALLNSSLDVEYEFVAIPARSWQPRKATIGRAVKIEAAP